MTPFRLAATVAAAAALLEAQRAFRVFEAMEGAASEADLPRDYNAKAELVLGRLMYPSRGGFGRRGGGDWLHGGTNWTVDYPRGDRTFAAAIRRLTLIDVRSVEQPVNPDDGGDIYYWPYLHVGMPGSWSLSDAQAAKIRDYLQRGGFLLCDSLFGSDEWKGFEEGLLAILPGAHVEDLSDGDALFHTLYDIKERYQVANFRSMARGRTYRADGSVPYWRAVRDGKGRVVVAITFNSDLGDSWQLADNPQYPEKYSALGIRLGLNYLIYSMTH